ncbi:hypothetical protein [Rubeoparvulum massiliense]|uniref:hypothetical protein n=1 Tax=Rubeoparvulum massiliense TaxID=1631346 RepID=UPI00065E8C5A|nr:hypothetical protein [Rubeoparvulum massiliense]
MVLNFISSCELWKCNTYRVQRAPTLIEVDEAIQHVLTKLIIYPEHHDQYLKECLENLSYKGIDIPL